MQIFLEGLNWAIGNMAQRSKLTFNHLNTTSSKSYSWFRHHIKAEKAILVQNTESQKILKVLEIKKIGKEERFLFMNLKAHHLKLFTKSGELLVEIIHFDEINNVSGYNGESRQICIRYRHTHIMGLIFEDIHSLCWFKSTVYHYLFPAFTLKQSEKFSKHSKVAIYTLTYNIGKIVEISEPQLDELLRPSKTSDLICLTFQEVGGIKKFLKEIKEYYLKDGFRMIGVSYMWEMCLIVFANPIMANNINNIEECTKKTGLASLVGNKGGMMLSFKLFDSTFAIIGCHLIHGSANQDKRVATIWVSIYIYIYRNSSNTSDLE